MASYPIPFDPMDPKTATEYPRKPSEIADDVPQITVNIHVRNPFMAGFSSYSATVPQGVTSRGLQAMLVARRVAGVGNNVAVWQTPHWVHLGLDYVAQDGDHLQMW